MVKDRFHQCRRWATLSLLNFTLLSLAGVLLRYKIAFSLPVLNYKYLLNAHSHFGFAGWVSLAIFTAFVYQLSHDMGSIPKSYRYQFNLGQVASFGMLISFIFQGYAAVSISFSCLSILFSYWFAWQFSKDLKKSKLSLPVKYFARAALFFYVLSSIGPYLLGYILSNRIYDSNIYQNSIYLFLHFQYNGFFSFAVLAIFFQSLRSAQIPVDEKKSLLVFWLFFAACIPAYCLSVLWTNPPLWVFILAAFAGLAQWTAVLMLLQLLWTIRPRLNASFSGHIKTFWILSLVAFCIKILLQGLSVVPALGKYAFGIRPVIIGYLHLVLLGFISFFLVGFFLSENLFRPVRTTISRIAIFIFITGVLANEIFLLLQAVYALAGKAWESSGGYLLGAAISIFVALSLFLAQQIKYRNSPGMAIPA